MFKHILIATDGSELAERAAAQGVGLAKVLNAKVTAVTVTEPWTAFLAGDAAIAFPFDEYDKGAAANAARILAATSEIAKKRTWPAPPLTSKTSSPPRASLLHARAMAAT
jgi:nucleotide-binding universal stress UspA family protein